MAGISDVLLGHYCTSVAGCTFHMIISDLSSTCRLQHPLCILSIVALIAAESFRGPPQVPVAGIHADSGTNQQVNSATHPLCSHSACRISVLVVIHSSRRGSQRFVICFLQDIINNLAGEE